MSKLNMMRKDLHNIEDILKTIDSIDPYAYLRDRQADDLIDLLETLESNIFSQLGVKETLLLKTQKTNVSTKPFVRGGIKIN